MKKFILNTSSSYERVVWSCLPFAVPSSRRSEQKKVRASRERLLRLRVYRRGEARRMVAIAVERRWDG
jgi:hypothetical protein